MLLAATRRRQENGQEVNVGKDPCNPPESGPWMPYGKHLTATTISTSSTHMLPEAVWGGWQQYLALLSDSAIAPRAWFLPSCLLPPLLSLPDLRRRNCAFLLHLRACRRALQLFQAAGFQRRCAAGCRPRSGAGHQGEQHAPWQPASIERSSATCCGNLSHACFALA